jgi:hypothetical protein
MRIPQDSAALYSNNPKNSGADKQKGLGNFFKLLDG